MAGVPYGVMQEVFEGNKRTRDKQKVIKETSF
jgi:hypothetical protein